MRTALLLLASLPLWGAAALVGTPGTTIADSVSSQGVTISASSAGNLLVTEIYHPSAITVSSVTSSGCTWSSAIASSSGNSRAEIWYCPNNGGGVTSITVTMSGSERWIARVSEWSGVATTTPLNAQNATAGAFGSAPSGSVTSVGSGSLVLATSGWNWSSTTSAGPTNSFTVLGTNINNATIQRSLVGAYKVGVAAGAQSTAWTISADVDWGVVAAAFTESGGGGGPAPPMRRRPVSLQ
jgi:hypothetical protein